MLMLKYIMIRERIRDFLTREDGASAIEYSIIAALIAAVIVVSVTNIGTEIKGVFDGIVTKLQGASGGGGTGGTGGN